MSDKWEDYESGPFCRHWTDPSMCEVCMAGCAVCGHSGFDHAFGDPALCSVCECLGFEEKEQIDGE